MKRSLYVIVFLAAVVFLACGAPEWQVCLSPVADGLHDVFLLNDKVGWAYTYGTGIVIKTTNGGEDWRVVSQLDSVYFEQIQFLDEHNGWMCGDYGKVLKTEDGGVTWLDRSIQEPGCRFAFYAMFFFDVETGFVGGMRMSSDRKVDYVLYKTVDRGETWRIVPESPNVFLTSIVFPTNTVGFANGGKNRIYKTDDGGTHWRLVYEGAPEREGFRGLFFLDENTGFGVNASGMFVRTTNSGKTWEETTITSNRLRSVLFVDDAEGYIVGDQNKEEDVLYRSTDGGVSWETIPSDYPDLHRIKRSAHYIWIVGKEGTILKKRIS